MAQLLSTMHDWAQTKQMDVSLDLIEVTNQVDPKDMVECCELKNYFCGQNV
jgi:hypothetical protein